MEASNIIGIDGNLTKTAYVNGANYSGTGQEDTMTTTFYDLDFDGTAELKFDIAKAQWSSSYNDAFRVEVSIDCGDSFMIVNLHCTLTREGSIFTVSLV